MPDLTTKTVTELVADSGNGVQDWAARQANHSTTPPGHGGWGRVDPGDEPDPVPDPVLTSLTPNTSSLAAGAVTVTVNGSDFESHAVVEVNDVAVPTTYVSATQLTVNYTPTAVGTVTFSVRQDPEESADVPFTVTA